MLKSRHPTFSEKFSIKIGMLFSKIPLSPNAWTILSLLPAVAGFYYLVLPKNLLYAAFLFIFAAFLDIVDGGVARVTRRVSNLGAYLDGVADRIVEASLFFGLMLYGVEEYILPGYLWAALTLFFGSAMTSYVSVYAGYKNTLNPELLKNMGGLLERMERIMLVFLGMLGGYFIAPIYLTYALIAVSLLAAITVIQRVVFVVKKAD